MAPKPGGGLYLSIPATGGTVVALHDERGSPVPGWPIRLPGTTSCASLLPVDDGSIRVVCLLPDDQTVGGESPVWAFAFDAGGNPMAGWPVELPCCFTARVIDDQLTVYGQEHFVTEPGGKAWIVTVAADGTLRSGAPVPFGPNCCSAGAIGPDGVAYGVEPIGEWAYGSVEMSRITALDTSGVQVGWPLSIDGIASGPAFGPDGRVVLTVGSFVEARSRVFAYNRDGEAELAVSAELSIATAQSGVDCIAWSPEAPIVAQDGTIFVFSEIDTAVFALDSSLGVMRGWPYRPETRLAYRVARPNYEGIDCGSLGVPTAGPDGVLYLPLQARQATVGGSIVAVGPDGVVLSGWPVELRRPGAEFWSVVVGPDGTAYALAIEPETGDASSATILAIDQFGTVHYRTTIIDP